MNVLRLLFLALVLWGSLPGWGQAAPPPSWEIRALDFNGELDYDSATGVYTASKGVLITYEEILLTADRVTANTVASEVLAEGNVTIKSHGHLWRGERVVYNFNTRQIQTADFKTGFGPFYIAGQGLGAIRTNNIYTARNVTLTTDDLQEPGYRIRARSMAFIPGQYFEAYHATFWMGKVPVAFFPHYKRNLGRHPLNLEYEPGFRSLYGPYLLTTFNWYANDKLDGAVHLDLRLRRGLAGGPDFNYDLGRLGRGNIAYYVAHDEDPGTFPNLWPASKAPATYLIEKPVPDNRHRVNFSHNATLRTNLTFKTTVRYQTDPWVVRDFYEDEYRQNVQPNTFVEVSQLWNNFTLDVLAQPRVNDFYQAVERLPDLKLTALRQQLGVLPLYYEGENSLALLERKHPDFSLWTHWNTNVFNNTNFSAYRADSYHQIVWPQTYLGWLNVTPRVGGRFSYYSEADGAGVVANKNERVVFNTGAEMSFKASRVWSGAQNNLLDVRGLRHIVTPSLNYVFVPRPSAQPPQLPQFDYEVPSLRLLPIDYPDYNAIDAVDSQNVLRFGLHNKLQTKRAEGVENVVNWLLFADWRLRPRQNQPTFSDLYSDLDFKPRSWVTFTSQTRCGLSTRQLREANHRLTLLPASHWSVALGHRYLGNAFGPDSGHNLLYDSLYYRLNENWAFRISHHFEARDGVLEEHSYTIYRDLRSWTAALVFRCRDNRSGPSDFTVAVTFSLKAYPKFGLNSDNDQPNLLLGL